jgi:hypothetical protein
MLGMVKSSPINSTIKVLEFADEHEKSHKKRGALRKMLPGSEALRLLKVIAVWELMHDWGF